jgi:hypothetical protein
MFTPTETCAFIVLEAKEAIPTIASNFIFFLSEFN